MAYGRVMQRIMAGQGGGAAPAAGTAAAGAGTTSLATQPVPDEDVYAPVKTYGEYFADNPEAMRQSHYVGSGTELGMNSDWGSLQNPYQYRNEYNAYLAGQDPVAAAVAGAGIPSSEALELYGTTGAQFGPGGTIEQAEAGVPTGEGMVEGGVPGTAQTGYGSQHALGIPIPEDPFNVGSRAGRGGFMANLQNMWR